MPACTNQIYYGRGGTRDWFCLMNAIIATFFASGKIYVNYSRLCCREEQSAAEGRFNVRNAAAPHAINMIYPSMPMIDGANLRAIVISIINYFEKLIKTDRPA